jgi:TonB family protein
VISVSWYRRDGGKCLTTECHAVAGRNHLTAFALLALIFGAADLGSAQDATRADALSQLEAALEATTADGDLTEAVRLAGEAIDLSSAVHGRNHLNTALRLVDLGTLLRRIGEQGAAFEHYLEAEAILTALLGPASTQHVDLLLRVALLYPSLSSARRQHAMRALQLQATLAPDNRLAWAHTAVRVGGLLVDQVAGNPEAEQILTEAVEILESNYGSTAAELVAGLSALADASARRSDAREQLRHYERALGIIRDHRGAETEAYADLALRAARHSLLLSVSDAGRRHLRDARAIYERILDAGHPKIGTARLAQGEFDIARRRYRAAEAPLVMAVQTFEGIEGEQANLLRALSLLIAALEHQGKGDAATPYLVRLAASRPEVAVVDFQPVVNVRPVYPSAEARRREEGFVLVEFVVDAAGRVRDPVVIESLGSSAFQVATLDAVRKLRYAPRIENGVAVDTPGVRNLFSFTLRD